MTLAAPVRGPVVRTLVALAAPVLAGLALKVAFNVVSIWWVGRLGSAAVAAVSTASFLYWLMLSVSEGVVVGTQSLVARATGAGDPEEVRRASRESMAWALLVGGAAGIALALGAEAAFSLMGVGEEVRPLGVAYVRIVGGGAPLLFLCSASDAIFRGLGRPRVSMSVFAGILLLNAALDPVLIFGLGPAPRLGVAGAAIATVVSFAVGAAASLVLVGRAMGTTPLGSVGSPTLAGGLRLVRIGLPVAANGTFFCLVYVLLTTITSRFGTPALAALGVGHKVESVAYLTTVAIASAAATMVGQALGAGDARRALRAAWTAVGLGAGAGLAAGAAFVALAEPIARLFLDEPAAVAAAASYIRIAGIAQALQAAEVVLDGVFGGAGDTLPPMIVGIPLTLARLPLAAWLAARPDLGVAGVFWAISATAMAKGVLLTAWFVVRPPRESRQTSAGS